MKPVLASVLIPVFGVLAPPDVRGSDPVSKGGDAVRTNDDAVRTTNDSTLKKNAAAGKAGATMRITPEYLLTHGFTKEKYSYKLKNVRLGDVARDLGFPISALRPTVGPAPFSAVRDVDLPEVSITVNAVWGRLDSPDAICSVSVVFPVTLKQPDATKPRAPGRILTGKYLREHGFKERGADDFVREHVRLGEVASELGFSLASLRPVIDVAALPDERRASGFRAAILVRSEVRDSRGVPVAKSLDHPDAICTVEVFLMPRLPR